MVLIGGFILLVLLINLPPVQDWFTKKLEQQLRETIGTRIEIGAVRLNLLADVVIEDLYLEDPNQEVVWASQRIKIYVALLAL